MCCHSACKLGFPLGHSGRRLNSPSRQDRTACQMHKGVLAKVVVFPFGCALLALRVTVWPRNATANRTPTRL